MNLSDLPAIDALALQLAPRFEVPTAVTMYACQVAVSSAREAIQNGNDADPVATAEKLLADIAAARPRSVVNATGVLLHTNLGRAPLAAAVSARASTITRTASNVEIDIRTGRRSKRHEYLGTLLPLVTHAEAGFAVNNNAGALLLALASVAGSGGRVAVSRGELIEIGGSFRLPDLMSASGAELVEVGTTNRTRPADYADVAGRVDAILKVHPSNYRIDGFQEEATYGELAQIAGEHGIPFVADVGSGLIDDTAPWLGARDRSWLADEPGVIQTVEAGADLVLFSGDKLLGGPQCGVLVGKKAAVERAKRHPIARAVRLDGPSIAAVSDTFEMYADNAVKDIPFWAMASSTTDQIEERALAVVAGLSITLDIVDGESVPGAGSVPGATIATKLIRISGNADATWQTLATSALPVIATRREDSVFLDMRSVLPDQDDAVKHALKGLDT
ncbi:MAG: L-seryl-tRNA(Sec) selenium transferase [Acidimicrobiia bacterium]|nr:MAG: L-seryl-tRNA(Sec) selenium transferase [Acidimicrobiia bacterium]